MVALIFLVIGIALGLAQLCWPARVFVPEATVLWTDEAWDLLVSYERASDLGKASSTSASKTPFQTAA
jgi:hypothetical protein